MEVNLVPQREVHSYTKCLELGEWPLQLRSGRPLPSFPDTPHELCLPRVNVGAAPSAGLSHVLFPYLEHAMVHPLHLTSFASFSSHLLWLLERSGQ